MFCFPTVTTLFGRAVQLAFVVNYHVIKHICSVQLLKLLLLLKLE